MTRLPVPSLTATIHLLPSTAPRHALGRVVVHGYVVPYQTIDVSRLDRSNAPHRCTRCLSVGLSGEGHSSRNIRCPSRSMPAQAELERKVRSRPAPKRRGTSRSRCAARYAWLCHCSLREAGVVFGISATAARDGWAEVYPGVAIVRGIGGGA
jgi:hypothetical protein